MPGFFNPSLEDMNKDVLAWNLYNMFTGKCGHKLQKVPIHFTSVDQYLDIFEPLLLEECRAQILRSFQEHSVTEHHLKLQGLQGEAHDHFRTLSFEPPADSATKPVFKDTDLVFVSHEQLDRERLDDEGNVKPQQFHALALVTGSTPGNLNLKLYLPEEGTPRLPSVELKRLATLRRVMKPSSGSWWVRKLGNMVTINREFQALYSVRELALAPVLLSPLAAAQRQSEAKPQSLQVPAALLRAIERSYNPSQLAAIRASLCGRGVSLIQGPPGTGKTLTILGILSVLLASGAERDADAPPPKHAEPPPARTAALLAAAAPWLRCNSAAPPPAASAASAAAAPAPASASADTFARADESDQWVQLSRARAEEPPKHVLVCAPSNAAIDEIVSRLLQRDSAGGAVSGGLLDARGERYVPLVVRVGPNVKEALAEVSLDTLAQVVVMPLAPPLRCFSPFL